MNAEKLTRGKVILIDSGALQIDKVCNGVVFFHLLINNKNESFCIPIDVFLKYLSDNEHEDVN